MIKGLVVWMIVAELAVTAAIPAMAQTASDCQRDPCPHQPTGEWHGNRTDVVQTANVSSSTDGVKANIAINRENPDSSAAPSRPRKNDFVGQFEDVGRGGEGD
jgi:hypothetical protein